MPTGLPPNLSSSVSNLFIRLEKHVEHVIVFFRIPSYNEVYSSASIAFHDSISASKSIWNLLHLTFQPLFILLALLSRYFFIVLKVIVEHSFQSSIIAVKEAWIQGQIAFRWFVQFQKSLSSAAIWMELGFIASLIGLYAIRRYIQKKRYVERIYKWHARKKRALQLKYEKFVDKVAQTSMVLALLLPHILYSILILLMKYFTPQLVHYLSSKTMTTQIISFWIPFVRTILIVHRWTSLNTAQKVTQNLGDSDKTTSSTTNGSNDHQRRSGSIFQVKKKAKVTDKYLQEASKSSKQSFKSSAKISAKNEINGGLQTESIAKYDEDVLMEETMELIKYWVAYALLCAFFQILNRIPIVGRIFSNVNGGSASSANTTKRWMSRNSSKASSIMNWCSKLKFSVQTIDESCFFFFIWLRMLPTSLTRSSDEEKQSGSNIDGNVKSKKKEWEKREKERYLRATKAPFTNRPLDIVYERLSPLAISLMTSSTNITQSIKAEHRKLNNTNHLEENTEQGFVLMRIIKWCQTFLDLMVWTKLISNQTKHRTIATLAECTALLPAAMTLLMPSYFTQFGVIYINLVIPAAYSANSHDIVWKNKMNDNEKSKDDITSLVRYLKYWIIHSILSFILFSFAPVLAWIPLSTHVTWLLWAYAQLQSITERWYSILEWELMAFGVLSLHCDDTSENGKLKSLDINQTVSAQLFRSVVNKLPSGVKESNNSFDADSSSHETDDSNFRAAAIKEENK